MQNGQKDALTDLAEAVPQMEQNPAPSASPDQQVVANDGEVITLAPHDTRKKG